MCEDETEPFRPLSDHSAGLESRLVRQRRLARDAVSNGQTVWPGITFVGVSGVGCWRARDNTNAAKFFKVIGQIEREAGVRHFFAEAHTGHQGVDEGKERARGPSEIGGWPDA